MIRNLLGAPVFKPDVHILKIVDDFFGGSADPVQALADAAKRHWPEVCTDKRFLPVHLGEVDYILWFYRSNGGEEWSGRAVSERSSAGSSN